jgi:hypothetical protein
MGGFFVSAMIRFVSAMIRSGRRDNPAHLRLEVTASAKPVIFSPLRKITA